MQKEGWVLMKMRRQEEDCEKRIKLINLNTKASVRKMSSSFIFMGAADDDDDKQNPTSRKSSSKPHKETLQNKKPRQRGMGVEKLERLRIHEEKLKKEINNINNFNITTTTTTTTSPASFSSLPPYGFMPPPTVGRGGGLNLISPVGFSNSQNVVGCTSGGGGGGGAFFPSSQGLLQQQQQQLHSDHDKLQGCQYLCRAAADVCKGAKVVALHMKENTRGNLLMEYDFFLTPRSSRSHNELVGGELESDYATALSIGIGGCAAAAAAASCVTTNSTTTTAAAEDDASTFIDLSLKLSY